MSFCISEEDQQYNKDKSNLPKTMSLLRMSQHIKSKKRVFTTAEIMDSDSNYFLRRFSNSEFWKISPY